MNFCRTLFLDDEEMNQRLDQIQAGRGHQDDAEDVVDLTRILLSSKKVKLPNSFFSEQDLRQSPEDAIQLMWLLKGRSEKRAAKSSPVDIWHRAYSKWMQDYERVMHAGQYLYVSAERNPQDIPKIHNSQVRRSAARDEEPQVES